MAGPNLAVVPPPLSEPAFVPEAEAELGARFVRDGHVVVPAEDAALLDRLRFATAAAAARHLGEPAPADPGAFLDTIHRRMGSERVNELRLAVLDSLNALPWVLPAYFSLARGAIGALVGSEIAMQRRLNLSVQMPDDETSVLPVHSDVWDGDSPYEVVLWVPLVDVAGSKSMFLLPPAANARHQANFRRFAGATVEDLYQAIAPDVVQPAVRYGEVMLFTQNIMHGNRRNTEPGTRWSFNCRVKGLLTPYADKRLGEFFEPVTLRPATRMGMEYVYPEGHDG